MATITQMQKVKVLFMNEIAFLIPIELEDKFIQTRNTIKTNADKEWFKSFFSDYMYKRGEIDLYVEAKGIYSKYNTENALK